ncbi:MAG: hypothetical protein ACQSGP_25215 [Frankia sp.]
MSLHVGEDWSARCLHFGDGARPILSVMVGQTHFSITAADEQMSTDHIDFAYVLLAAVNDYLIECERLIPLPEMETGAGPLAA